MMKYWGIIFYLYSRLSMEECMNEALEQACCKRHSNIESLKKSIAEAVAHFPTDIIHSSVDKWPDRLQAHVKVEGRMDVKCTFDDRIWWEFNQPSVVVDPFDENFGRCLGWKGKPEFHDCAARWPTVRRLCQCAKDVQCSKRFQQ